ncbi:MAG: peptidase [Rhodoferax sp.]|nr:peptidase [Rhodoferax sp.]
MTMDKAMSTDADIVQAMQRWLERAVIGLNLCPFAKAVHVKGQIHYAVCHATTSPALREALAQELDALMAMDAEVRDTTLLIAPDMLANFIDFNDFLAEADDVLVERDLDGIVQIASFHPDYQFGGTAPDDITNYTNRAPYPTLHLLREDSVDRAVQAFPEAETIFERNMATLEALGHAGWSALGLDAAAQPSNIKT